MSEAFLFKNPVTTVPGFNKNRPLTFQQLSVLLTGRMGSPDIS